MGMGMGMGMGMERTDAHMVHTTHSFTHGYGHVCHSIMEPPPRRTAVNAVA